MYTPRFPDDEKQPIGILLVNLGTPGAPDTASVRCSRKNLLFSEDQCLPIFQSKLGPTQWLQPYTDVTVERLAANGIKSLDVVCPGFSVDCRKPLRRSR